MHLDSWAKVAKMFALEIEPVRRFIGRVFFYWLIMEVETRIP